MAQYPFKVNYVDIKGMEGQDMAVFKIEDATSTDTVFQIYPRGRANFHNYANDAAFTITQHTLNRDLLRLYASQTGMFNGYGIRMSAQQFGSVIIDVNDNVSGNILQLSNHALTIGSLSSSGFSNMVTVVGGQTIQYAAHFRVEANGPRIDFYDYSNLYTFFDLNPCINGNTAYSLGTKVSYTSGTLFDIKNYQTSVFNVNYTGTATANALVSDNLTSRTTDANLVLSGNGTGYVRCEDEFRIKSIVNGVDPNLYLETFSGQTAFLRLVGTTLVHQVQSGGYHLISIGSATMATIETTQLQSLVPIVAGGTGANSTVKTDYITSYNSNTNLSISANGNGIVIVNDQLKVEGNVVKWGQNAGSSYALTSTAVFIGSNSGRVTTVSDNVFIGLNSGYSNTTGQYNIVFGYNAFYFNQTGSNNFVAGLQAGQGSANNSYSNNCLIGPDAGFSLTTGSNNVFIGQRSGSSNTNTINNVYIGESSGRYNIGSYNVALGREAGQGTSGQSTYTSNCFIGQYSGKSSTTGSYNAFYGDNSGIANTTGQYNTFIGQSAGSSNTTASENTFIGRSSGTFNTTGGQNTYIGTGAGNKNQTGGSNVCVGYWAGIGQSAGTSDYQLNTLVGYQSAYNITTGNGNSCFGALTSNALTTGIYNTVVGYQSGNNLSTGSYNVFVGYTAGNGLVSGSNVICIGKGAFPSSATATNQCIIGGTAGDAVNVGIGGNNNPQYALDVTGTVNATAYRVGGVAGAVGGTFTTITSITVTNGIITAISGT